MFGRFHPCLQIFHLVRSRRGVVHQGRFVTTAEGRRFRWVIVAGTGKDIDVGIEKDIKTA